MSARDQLPLDLPAAGRFEAEDFLVSDANRAAHALLARWPDWPDRALVLVGPEGSGKSHLAALWARRAGALRASPASPDASLASDRAVLVEDADRIARGPGAEAALFDLLNAARAGGPFVLLTARVAPSAWGLATPDLLSRLRLAPLARLGGPDEALMRALVVKLFLDRGLVVDAGVVEALARRLDRSFAAARDAVAALDRDALVRGRRVTRAGVAALVGDDPGRDDSERDDSERDDSERDDSERDDSERDDSERDDSERDDSERDDSGPDEDDVATAGTPGTER